MVKIWQKNSVKNDKESHYEKNNLDLFAVHSWISERYNSREENFQTSEKSKSFIY